MTEAEWLASSDRDSAISFLKNRTSDRKLRLYVCAGCRAIWPLLTLRESQEAVEVAERFADREASDEELARAEYDAEADCLYERLDSGLSVDAAWLAHYAAGGELFRCNPEHDKPFGFYSWCSNRLRSMNRVSWPGHWLIRDVFGNPFRPVAFSPAWRTETVLALARQMYESRDFFAMPVLADALQDADCDCDDVLNHCREPGEHVRGCWVIDLVLGKE